MSNSNVVETQCEQPCGHEGRKQRRVEKCTIRVGNEFLEFRTLELADPVPSGRQIIEIAGFRPLEECLIFEISHDRRLTELKLDQTTDIRRYREARFLIFRSDRSWRGILDGKRFEWGAREILGRVLKWLANVDSEKYGVWFELRDEPDRPIADNESVSLSPTGIERFRTDLLIQLCIEDKTYLWPRNTIKTEEIAELGGWDVSQGVIEVDEDQNERTLTPGEVVKLRPDLTFGKKLRFKRGYP